MTKPGPKPQTHGPYQNSPISYAAYAVAIRMLAENHGPTRILEEVHARHPEHRPDGASPVSIHTIVNIRKRRQQEIGELRAKLNSELDSLWIANKRQRLEALQFIFMDANRWAPDKLLENKVSGQTLVVYKKDTRTMLRALQQAREELGADAGGRIAQSLEDLVRQAEQERGLTETIDVKPQESVPVIEDAMLVDVPASYRTHGDSKAKGLRAGDTLPEDDAALTETPTDS